MIALIVWTQIHKTEHNHASIHNMRVYYGIGRLTIEVHDIEQQLHTGTKDSPVTPLMKVTLDASADPAASLCNWPVSMGKPLPRALHPTRST